MKIYVLNLIGKRATRALVAVALVTVLLISSVIGFVSLSMGEDLAIVAANTIPQDKLIIIDAGHGGEDSGAVGVSGVLEKDLNLQIALQVGRFFEEKGYIVVYTRTDDRLLYTEEENIKGIRKISDLKNRCKIAERYPNSIFISIHMNSFGSSKYSGLQAYYTPGNDSSKALASKIQSKVASDLQKDNKRKIKSGEDIFLLNNMQNTAVLIECGFLTNREECEKLSEKEYQKELSFSIVCAIIEYIESSN